MKSALQLSCSCTHAHLRFTTHRQQAFDAAATLYVEDIGGLVWSSFATQTAILVLVFATVSAPLRLSVSCGATSLAA